VWSLSSTPVSSLTTKVRRGGYIPRSHHHVQLDRHTSDDPNTQVEAEDESRTVVILPASSSAEMLTSVRADVNRLAFETGPSDDNTLWGVVLRVKWIIALRGGTENQRAGLIKAT
jgi:hypothetical protein